MTPGEEFRAGAEAGKDFAPEGDLAWYWGFWAGWLAGTARWHMRQWTWWLR